VAIVVETEASGEADGPIRGQIPGDDGGKVVRCIGKAQNLRVAQAAVHLDAGDEILAAEIAAVGRSFQGERAAGSQGIGKFPRLARGKILGENRIERDIPAFECAGEEKLEFEFVIVFLTQYTVGLGEIGFDVVAFDFLQDFVGAAGLLVFNIEHRIDEMFTVEQAKAILHAKAGEDRAIGKCGLAVEVKLGGPPGGRPIFEFEPEGMKIIAAALGAESGEIFDLEIARLLEIVIISDDVRALLRGQRSACG